MNDVTLYITTEDYARLRLLLPGSASSHSAALEQLRRELDRAVIIDPKAIPPGIVTMGSHVEIEDVATGEIDAYTLVFPEHAAIEHGRLSILAPIGTAIIGYAQGTEVDWMTPGGTRRIRIVRVVQPDNAPAPAGTR